MVSGAGRIVVGYCSFDESPFSTTGFVWTRAMGVIYVNQVLDSNLLRSSTSPR